MVGPSPDPGPRQRVVLLGASNLARGIATAVAHLRGIWPGPLDLLAALGHGRSYGMTSSLLGRRLPGIAECGLWEDLARRSAVRAGNAADSPLTAAILTDVGNDILYGASPAQIGQWVASCLDRLQLTGCRPVVTGVPLEGLEGLSERRFWLLRTLFYPSSRLSLEGALDAAHRLDRRLAELARERELPFLRPRADWFGLDPIHFRRSCSGAAWGHFFSPWSEPGLSARSARASLREWFYLRTRPPCERSWLGIVRNRPQPAGRLADGTTISLY